MDEEVREEGGMNRSTKKGKETIHCLTFYMQKYKRKSLHCYIFEKFNSSVEEDNEAK